MGVLKEGDLNVSINIGGTTKSIDIPVKIEYGVEPIVRFTLPENKTDKTITYVQLTMFLREREQCDSVQSLILTIMV